MQRYGFTIIFQSPGIFYTFVEMRKIGVYLVRGLVRVIGRLPLRVLYAVLSPVLVFVAERIMRYRSTEVAVNLSRAFPNLKYRKIKELQHDFYRHFGDIATEAVWFGASHDPGRLRRQGICTVANPEVIRDLLDSAPSVVVMSAHTGNWELLGGMPYYLSESGEETGLQDQECCVVYKQLSSAFWDEVIAKNRQAPIQDPSFDGYVESHSLLRYAVVHRKEKKVYGIITDQRPYGYARDSMEVEFMHQPCRTMTGGVTLARKFGMAVAHASMQPASRGHYVFEYTVICQDASQMSEEEIIRRYYKLVERDIEAAPANYLWSHKRWN